VERFLLTSETGQSLKLQNTENVREERAEIVEPIGANPGRTMELSH